jgi:hypothetical protein
VSTNGYAPEAANGDASQEPVSAATATFWRRRRQACEVLDPLNGKTAANEGHAAADGAALDSPDIAARAFAESQHAGLAAIMGLAEANAPPRPRPVAKPGVPQPRLPQPSNGSVSVGPPARLVRSRALPIAETDVPTAPARPSPVTPEPPHARAAQARLERRTRWNSLKFGHTPLLPLTVIVTVQACLSARLLHANTAFQDEALYLWAGHLEWAHWLHGTSIPPFPAYFSGSPAIYPPIGALADSLGGLTGARILSLCFMIGATGLLWATTSRLYGRRAAFFAAGIWALLGPTQFLGAFATFDAMSLFLITLATWCAVRGVQHEDATKWLLGGAVALVLANAAKYASALFDPVVVAVTILAAFPRPGGKAAVGHGASMVTYIVALLVSLVTLGGGVYWAGIRSTTLARTDGTDSPTVVFAHSWPLIGTVVVAAASGAVLGMFRERHMHDRILIAVLAGAGLLVPIEQAHIHTITSLTKHLDFGAWFAAIAAGYAVDRLVILIRVRTFRTMALSSCAAALVIVAAVGMAQGQTFFSEWPDSSPSIEALRPLVATSSERMLVETASEPEYYLPAGRAWQRWSSTFSIVLPSGRTIGHSGGITSAGASDVYARYIARGYFSLVALNFRETPQLDAQIAYDLGRNPVYHIIDSVPYAGGRYVIWKYEAHRAGQ